MPLAELAGRAMGAEFFFGLATLKIPHMQHALESAGWQLIGFSSGYDREMVAPGVIKRVFEGVYCKVLVPEEELLRPDPNNMTPTAKRCSRRCFRASRHEPRTRSRRAEHEMAHHRRNGEFGAVTERLPL